VTRRAPAPLLVLAAVISVQFGGAMAARLIPLVGVFGGAGFAKTGGSLHVMRSTLVDAVAGFLDLRVIEQADFEVALRVEA